MMDSCVDAPEVHLFGLAPRCLSRRPIPHPPPKPLSAKIRATRVVSPPSIGVAPPYLANSLSKAAESRLSGRQARFNIS